MLRSTHISNRVKFCSVTSHHRSKHLEKEDCCGRSVVRIVTTSEMQNHEALDDGHGVDGLAGCAVLVVLDCACANLGVCLLVSEYFDVTGVSPIAVSQSRSEDCQMRGDPSSRLNQNP